MKKLNLIKIATPIFFEILLFMLLGVADTFMLSHYGSLETSKVAVDAVGMSNQLIGNVQILFSFISAGTAVLIAQNIGAKNELEIKRVSSVSLGLNFILGISFSIFLVWQGRAILSMLGLSGQRLIEAVKYLNIVGGFMVVQALLNTITAIIRSHGDTHVTLRVTVGMNIINVIGDAIFIFGLFGAPVLGVMGVAIATTFSRLLAFIVLSIILFKKYIHLSDLKCLFMKPVSEIRKLLKIGVPSAMENLSYNLSQTVLASLVLNYLPEGSFTTRIYVFQIAWFIMLFGAAIGQGTQIMVGQYAGAKSFDLAYKTCMKNFRISISITLALSLALYLFGDHLVGLYTSDPNIIKLGATVLVVDALLEPGRTFNLVIINGLRGAGDVIFPVVMAIVFMWGLSIGFGFILAVPFKLGLIGFWIGMALDEWTRGFIMYLRWRSRKWESKVMV